MRESTKDALISFINAIQIGVPQKALLVAYVETISLNATDQSIALDIHKAFSEAVKHHGAHAHKEFEAWINKEYS